MKNQFRRGEQQIGNKLSEIRADHVARYRWAAEKLKPREPRFVLDAACGCGYGTAMLADALPEARIGGVDIHGPAVNYAQRNWGRPNAMYAVMDVAKLDLGPYVGRLDATVSFETLEHTKHYDAFAKKVHEALRPGGVWLVSVPNEDVIPFEKGKWPFHVRHFSPYDLTFLLNQVGFAISGWFGQRKREDEVTEGAVGKKHIIAIAVKP